jgi:hypothetical protein
LGFLQRKVNGSFYGSPHPWLPVSEGGCGVDPSVVVAQDIECAMECVALKHLGLNDLASRLFRTVFNRPLKKWINVANGEGVGSEGADSFNVWFAMVAEDDYQYLAEVCLRWNVPKPDYMGGLNPLCTSVPQVNTKLRVWNCPGKSIWAQRKLARAV